MLKAMMPKSVGSGPRVVPGLLQNGAVESTAVHRNLSGLASLCHDWENLLSSGRDLTIFSTMEWLQSWWRAFGKDAELRCLSFSKGDDLVGVAPLLRSRLSVFGGRLKRLAFVGAGSGDSDNLDFLTRPGYERGCVTTFIDWLGRDPDWDICCLETLPEDSRILPSLIQKLSELSWPHYITPIPHSYVSLPNTWEEYLKRLDPKFRPLLTRYPKRLESRYRCQFIRCETQEQLNQYLPVFFELHQMRWRQNGELGVFSDADRRCFYEYMAKSFLQRGWLEFWVLELDGVPRATQFCFRYHNTVYLLQEGFDPQYADEKVGYALRAHMLRHFIQSGVTRYDFLGGADTYKLKFGAALGSYVTVKFARPHTAGDLYLRLERSAERTRRRLRAVLPPSILSLIRNMRLSVGRDGGN